MAHPARKRNRPVRRIRSKRIAIDPYPLALFEEMYFARAERKDYERDEKGRFKSKEPDRFAPRDRV